MDTLVFFVVAFGLCSASASDTALNCTNPHEVQDCLFVCPPQRTCWNYKYALPCIPPTGSCKPQCVCEDGYARNYDGICVTLAQCEQCSANGQYFTCNGAYDEHCAGSCLCQDGYKQAANNTCVSTSTTPPPVIASPPPFPPTPVNPPSSGPVSPPSSGPNPCTSSEGTPSGITAELAEPPTGDSEQTNETWPTNPTGETNPTCETNPTGQTNPTD